MPKCTICGREASLLFHGLWWCENHEDFLGEEINKEGNIGIKKTEELKLEEKSTERKMVTQKAKITGIEIGEEKEEIKITPDHREGARQKDYDLGLKQI